MTLPSDLPTSEKEGRLKTPWKRRLAGLAAACGLVALAAFLAARYFAPQPWYAVINAPQAHMMVWMRAPVESVALPDGTVARFTDEEPSFSGYLLAGSVVRFRAGWTMKVGEGVEFSGRMYKGSSDAPLDIIVESDGRIREGRLRGPD